MSNIHELPFLQEKLQELEDQGLYRKLPILESANEAEIILNGQKVINLSSNNYLGFANHPRLKTAAIEAVEKYGVGSGAVRTIVGNMDIHEKLERKLALFKREEAVMVFQSGFNCNAGTIQAITRKGDLIISDELNHASIIDGIRLSRADKTIYKHSNMEDLERVLKENKDKYNTMLIITDGVFSMDGDIVKLPEIVDFCIGTLSKAIGVIGGYIAGRKVTQEWLNHRGRPILFSTSFPPATIGAITEAVDMLMETTEFTDHLWSNARFFKEELSKLGFNLGNSETPITPVIIGDETCTMKFSNKLLEYGVFVSGIVFPTVPKGTGRVRCMVTAGHTQEQLIQAVKIFERVGNYLTL